MNTWFEYQPVDTVFCKGAEPMEMGEHHSASSIFPPPPETIAGAVRSAVLEQQKISIPDYYQGNVDKEIITAIGRAGQKAPFEIIGPFFLNCKECYVPAPYFWFTEKTQLKNNSKVTIYRARPLSTSLIKSDLPASRLYWAKGKKDILTTLGGHYIKMTDLFAQKEQIEVKKSSDFFIFEQRTGIALSHNRTVREGHLYSFNHGRLKTMSNWSLALQQRFPSQTEECLNWVVSNVLVITASCRSHLCNLNNKQITIIIICLYHYILLTRLMQTC